MATSNADPAQAIPEADDEEKQLHEQNGVSTETIDEKAFLVDWDDNDSDNPHNWSTLYRGWLTFQLSMLALAASLASSIIAPANPVLAKYLGVSEEAIVLNVSLYV